MGQGCRWLADIFNQTHIVVLQYRCRPHSTWTQVGKQVTDVVACDYSPYQLVQCRVKAYNTAGSGQAASSSVRTGCDGKCEMSATVLVVIETWLTSVTAPLPPTDLEVLEINKTSDSGRERWRYRISWKVWNAAVMNMMIAYLIPN